MDWTPFEKPGTSPSIPGHQLALQFAQQVITDKTPSIPHGICIPTPSPTSQETRDHILASD